MRLAISNIAWHANEEDKIAELLVNLGVRGVEIAPTTRWQEPLTISSKELVNYRTFWNSRGIEIIALQSLLYGRPDLEIFGTLQKRIETMDYLKGLIRLGSALGASILVFGSPKNRLTRSLSVSQIDDISTKFFRELAKSAMEYGVCFCIEPNPIAYGADFVTSTEEAVVLAQKVDSPGFGINVDAGAIKLNNESARQVLKISGPFMKHFHISEPFLDPVGVDPDFHTKVAQILKQHSYEHWVSVEMTKMPTTTSYSTVLRALEFSASCYLNNRTF